LVGALSADDAMDSMLGLQQIVALLFLRSGVALQCGWVMKVALVTRLPVLGHGAALALKSDASLHCDNASPMAVTMAVMAL